MLLVRRQKSEILRVVSDGMGGYVTGKYAAQLSADSGVDSTQTHRVVL